MMIAPSQAAGVAVVELVVQTTRLWSQLVFAPLPWNAPAASSLAVAQPRPSPPTVVTDAERLSSLADADAPLTDHALLVLLGHFAQHLGLLDQLKLVPLEQKKVRHTPQSKLIAFLVAILAGVEHLKDLNDAAAPLAADPTLAQAWALPAFAHYSGVSRTLAAADEQTLVRVREALATVSQPFIEREVLAILRDGKPLLLDIDLTGRPVSPRATSYPDAAFGWMDDAVANGYQSAISSLSGGPSGRLLLASQRYSGKASSAECLRAAVSALEVQLGLRPLRRVEVVRAHLEQLGATLAACQQTQQQATAQLHTAQERHSRLAAQAASEPERLVRAEQRLSKLAARVRKLERELWQLQQQQRERQEWLSQLEADNLTLTSEVRLVLRVDAGFATEANLAWLWEMGYTVFSKVHSGQTTQRLQRSIAAGALWTEVGANAEALALGRVQLGKGQLEAWALQVRYHLPEGLRHTTLVYLGDEGPPTAQEWFGRYNGRQTVEAGIKENKGVFTMRRPLVRSPIGMQLQEAFALFAANFVRWAAAWVRANVQEVPAELAKALGEVKTLVRVIAHSRARVVVSEAGCALVFDAHSAFAGAVLVVRGRPVYQTVLPLFTAGATAPREVT
jgi:hypothetical protein